MKRILIIAVTLLVTVSCKNDDDSIIEGDKQFVVNKVFDYNNNIIAEYSYNENYQLTHRLLTINEASTEHKFEYTNNKISKIEYLDYTNPSFNHTIFVSYNEQGQIIHDETHQYGNIIEVNDYDYYENGKVKRCEKVSEGLNSKFTYIYDITSNLEKVIARLPEFNEGGISTGNYVERTYNYEYDNGNQPNFGVGEIFQFEPLPGFGTLATFEKNISKNNMTKHVFSGNEWLYTYNDFSLPETIEAIRYGVETEEPILFRIKYKEIE